MLENLIKEKQNKIAEYEKIKDTLKIEKRSAFNNDEREKANTLKIEIENLNEQIKIEEAIQTEKRSLASSKVDVNVPVNVKGETKAIVEETELALRNFIEGKSVDGSFLKEGKFQLTPDYQTIKRATITTGTNPAFTKTETLDQISVQNSDLVLQKAGAVRYIFEANKGNVKAPSMSQLKGVFVAEGASTSELSITTASATLTPTYMVVPLKVSKAFIATQSAANFSSLISQMLIGIENGLEERAFKALSGLTAQSITGNSFFYHSLKMEEAVIGAGSAYVLSRQGTTLAKRALIGTAGSDRVWQNGQINSYNAYRSSILSDVRQNDGYYGNFKDLALATFGPVSIEMISDSALALAGEVMLVVSVMADAKVINSASFARVDDINTLS